MEQTEEYYNNLKELAFALNCNLSNLDAGIPDLDAILHHCGFDSDFIAITRKRLEEDDNIQSLIFYIPSEVLNKDVDSFERDFDLIVGHEKFDRLKLPEHRNNLLLLVLLLHDYFFINPNGEPLHRKKRKSSDEPETESETEEVLDIINDELKKGKEVADLIEIITDINKSDRELNIQIGKYKASIVTKGLRSKIAESIENILLNSTYDDLGAGLALTIDYLDYQKSGNSMNLMKEIRKMQAMKTVIHAPLLNKAISGFSLLIRNYLVHNSIANVLPLLPNDLLDFIQELFILLKVDYTTHPQSMDLSRKQLRKIISDFIDANGLNDQEETG